MGRALLIQVRELVSSGVLLGWVDVFSGGLEAEGCISNNGIRSGPLLGSVCFGISLVFRIYTTPLFCSPCLPVFVRLVQRSFLLIIYLPFKKKNFML
jgi:hypothetical protein